MGFFEGELIGVFWVDNIGGMLRIWRRDFEELPRIVAVFDGLRFVFRGED